MQRPIHPPRPARPWGPRAEPRIVRINRTQAPDLLHVVGSAADRNSPIEQRAIGLKPGEPPIAELFLQCGTVKPQPVGLEVENDAKLLYSVHRPGGNEVRMSNAG